MFRWLDYLQPLGTTLLRLVLGAVMLAHGYNKIIPHGALYTFAHFVQTLGVPYWLGYVAAATEFFGGLLLVVGLFTRGAALACAIDMAVAILKVHLHHGLTGPQGFEFPLTLLIVALSLVFTGPGWLATDALLGGSNAVRSGSRSRR